MKGGTLQLATLEAPFDDTVPLDDMSASSPDSPAAVNVVPPRQQPQPDFVEGQIMPVPEHVVNAYDTAPIVDSDEGRSYESEGTTVQTVLPAPVSRTVAFSSVVVLFLINLLNYMDRYTIAGRLENLLFLFLCEICYCFCFPFVVSFFYCFIVRIKSFIRKKKERFIMR